MTYRVLPFSIRHLRALNAMALPSIPLKTLKRFCFHIRRSPSPIVAGAGATHRGQNAMTAVIGPHPNAPTEALEVINQL